MAALEETNTTEDVPQDLKDKINNQFKEIIGKLNERRDELLQQIESINIPATAESEETTESSLNIPLTLDIDFKTIELYSTISNLGTIIYGIPPQNPQLNIFSIHPTFIKFSYTYDKTPNNLQISNDNNIEFPEVTEFKTQHVKYQYDDDDDQKLPSNQQIDDEMKLEWIDNKYDVNHWPSGYELWDLDGLTKYMVRVALKNRIGWSSWSNPKAIQTPKAPLVIKLIPNNLDATSKQDAQKKSDINKDGHDDDEKEQNADPIDLQLVDVAGLKEGDKCDVLDNWQGWYEAEVVGIDEEHGFRIKFLNWSDMYNEWVKKDAVDRFAPINTKTLIFEESKAEFPTGIVSCPHWYRSKIDDKDYMVLICKEGSILRYDVFNDKYDVFMVDQLFMNLEDGTDWDLDEARLFIPTVMDTNRNILYVIVSMDDIRSLDLDNKQWINEQQTETNKDTSKFKRIGSVFVDEGETGYCYLYPKEAEESDGGKIYHGIYDGKEIKQIEVDIEREYKRTEDEDNRLSVNRFTRLIYIKSLNEILLISDNCMAYGKKWKHKWKYMKLDDIDTRQKWQCIDIELESSSHHQCILAFDHLLFIIESSHPRRIFCWDIMSNKLYQCQKNLPKTIGSNISRYQYGVKCDNYVYLWETKNNGQIRINLYDLIPNQLYQYYSGQKLTFLVAGYLRQVQKKFDYIIPLQLLNEIITFYPVFV